MPNTPGARLAAALLGYVALILLLLTLSPFYLVPPATLALSWRVLPDDVAANLALFLPIGFLYRLTRGRRRTALLLGAGLSAGIETAQVFIPVRTASAVDLLTNTLGTALGVWLHDRLAAHLAVTPRLAGRLALEIPLMGFLYLLVPLLWVNTLTLGALPERWVLTALIGACGAGVLSEVARQWWGPAGLRSGGRAALAAGVWFLAGAGPGLVRPLPMLALTAGVALLAGGLAALPLRSPDRRFERAVLRRLLPVFAAYLLLAALWPPGRPLAPWHGMLGLTNQLEDESVSSLFPLIEYLAAFTLLGYLSAEWRGRSELPLRRDLPRLLVTALAGAVALEGLAGFQAGPGASLLRVAVVAGGAVFGGSLYHLQRAQVRSLLGRPPAQPQPEK